MGTVVFAEGSGTGSGEEVIKFIMGHSNGMSTITDNTDRNSPNNVWLDPRW